MSVPLFPFRPKLAILHAGQKQPSHHRRYQGSVCPDCCKPFIETRFVQVLAVSFLIVDVGCVLSEKTKFAQYAAQVAQWPPCSGHAEGSCLDQWSRGLSEASSLPLHLVLRKARCTQSPRSGTAFSVKRKIVFSTTQANSHPIAPVAQVRQVAQFSIYGAACSHPWPRSGRRLPLRSLELVSQ